MSSIPAAQPQITVNGEARSLGDLACVRDLVTLLALDARTVAVELNREIVPRSSYGTTPLNAGDSIEIVRFIGGG